MIHNNSPLLADVGRTIGSRSGTVVRLLAAASLLAVAASCSSEAPTPDQVRARANDAFAADQYDQAERSYRELLRLAPADPTALRQLAIIYSEQGQLVQAFQLLRKVAEQQPDDAEVQLRLGLALLAVGELSQAREAALKALEQQPGDERALLLLVDTGVSPQEITEIESLVKALRQKDQDRAGYHLALGGLAVRQKDPTRAESEFKSAIKLNAKSSQAYAALGLLYWGRKNLAAAEAALKSAADLSPLRSPSRLLYADFKLRSGADAEARAILEDLNKKIPDALPPRVALMKIVCAGKRDDDCAARVKDILARDSTNFDATLQNGILSLAKGDSSRAIRDFEYLSKIFRNNAQIRHQLALAYLQSAKGANEASSRSAMEAAESNLSEAIRLSPLFEQAVLLFAELKIRRGSSVAAIEPLTRLLKERPQLAQAHYLLATAFVAQSRSDQALAVYQKMTELFPQDGQAHFLLGTTWLTQHQPSQARRAFEKAIALSPDDLRPVEMLVDLDIAEKRYAEGMDLVQSRLDKDPKQAQLWALRAKLHFAQKDFARAEPDLLKAIELDGNFAPAHVMLARLYLASNRQQEAIERLNASVEKRKTPAALQLLGAIHEQTKNYSASRDAYEALLTLTPNSLLALNNLAVLYGEHLNELDKAHDLAKRARERNSNDPNIADTLGWILFKKGEYSQALRLLQESASRLANNPEVQFHLGMAHYMLGDEQAARTALQSASDASADFPGRSEARSRLALLAINVATADAAARTEVQNQLKQRPNDPLALVRFAAFQERDGATEQAIKTYEKIAADYPLFGPAIRRLALLYIERPADNARAFDFATKARQIYPDDVEVAKALGILNYRRELYPRAIELLRQAASKRRDDPELLYYLGDAHRHLKQWPECRAALEEATILKLAPTLLDPAKRALEECISQL